MRISDWSSDVCSSDLNDPKRILPPIKHEPTSQTGLTHDDGALSMARYAPGSATGDFFIVLGKMPGMDAHPEAPGDNQGRSEERRVGKEWVSKCRSRWSPYH